MPEQEATASARVLLVEDNAADVRLVQELLAELPGVDFSVQDAATLSEALQRLESNAFDIVLLDLRLPDSDGVETLGRLRRRFPHVPIVVLTGVGDDALGEEVVRTGAQEYLLKDELDAPTLGRSLRHARARRELQDWLEREVTALERVAGLPPTPIVARIYTSQPLREALPAVFEELVCAYASTLDLAVEARNLRTDESPATRLRVIAERLAGLAAGPRDVIDVHTMALRRSSGQGSSARLRVTVEEGRLIVLELMGMLVSIYRGLAVGGRSRASVSPADVPTNPESRR